MSNQHVEKPGKGVLFYELDEQRKSDKSPDYKGFIVLEMDYKAGEKLKISAWTKSTSIGKTLISLAEDNYFKKQKLADQQPKEVQSGYQKKNPDYAIRGGDDDIPF